MYYTCFFSNLYLGGIKTIDDLGHSYGTMAASGVNVVHDWAIGVDRDAKTVTLAGGASVPYDKLILSPGIDFVEGAVAGWDLSSQNAMPHAYKGGSQPNCSKRKLLRCLRVAHLRWWRHQTPTVALLDPMSGCQWWRII